MKLIVTQEHLDKAIEYKEKFGFKVCMQCVMGVAVNELLKEPYYATVAQGVIEIRKEDNNPNVYYLDKPKVWFGLSDGKWDERFSNNITHFDNRNYGNVVLGEIEIPDIPAEYLK